MVSTVSKAILTGLACGTLGVALGSFWAFREAPVQQEPLRTMVRPAPALGGAALAEVSDGDHEVSVSRSETPTQPSVVTASARQGASSPPPAASGDTAMQVKRLVVTDRIQGREPALDPDFRADGGEVFAFVELSNPGEEPQNIEIVFEHESGQQVGFVKLPVPKDKSRWRTWGKTQQIKQGGRWVAKVRNEGGAELMRQDFVVQQS